MGVRVAKLEVALASVERENRVQGEQIRAQSEQIRAQSEQIASLKAENKELREQIVSLQNKLEKQTEEIESRWVKFLESLGHSIPGRPKPHDAPPANDDPSGRKEHADL